MALPRILTVLMVVTLFQVSQAQATERLDVTKLPRVATFVPVCRDARGSWDRRACRHVARRDAHRLVLA